MAVKNKSNEIKITRTYDAPVKAVWDAWTDPKQVAQWWGPRGFSITTHSKDLRKGGHWSYTMHGPKGDTYENKTLYIEVEKYSRLVYDHGGNDDRPPLFRVTVNFSETKGKTRMEMAMAFETPEVATEMGKFIKMAGGNSTWDRLAEYLEKESTGTEKFVINRSFAGPIDLLFDMWIKPEHFSKWLPPTGMEMKFIRADIQPGGTLFYAMFNADMKIHGRIKYLEIEKPNRLVYVQQFCDENEKMIKPVFAPTWPDAMKTTVILTEEAPNQTRVTITWEIEGKFTPEELKTFVQEKPGMTLGWTGSFDKLDDLLPKD